MDDKAGGAPAAAARHSFRQGFACIARSAEKILRRRAARYLTSGLATKKLLAVRMNRLLSCLFGVVMLLAASVPARATDTLQVSVFISDLNYVPTVSYQSGFATLTFKDAVLTSLMSNIPDLLFCKAVCVGSAIPQSILCGNRVR